MSRAGYSTRTSAEMYLWFLPGVRTLLGCPVALEVRDQWLGINGL